ncbi:MAG TPA: RDD family protein [Mariprofundaceae bacterium]|nr:RDD family protein [Mariprofundaceae bacterium]
MAETPRPKAVKAGISIRLLASCYDALILLGLLFLAFIPVTMAEHMLGPIDQWIKGLLISTIAYAYFVGFWVKGGATTGMRPWKLQVAMNHSGDPLSLMAGSARFAGMMLTWVALGMTVLYMMHRDTGHLLFFISALIPAFSLLAMLMTRERQSLHDLVSGTSVYRLE